MGKKYIKNQTVAIYDCAFDGKLTPTGMMNYFQQCVLEQNESLGCGLERMLADGLSWVLVKYDLHITDRPKCSTCVEVETEPIGDRRTFAYRHFEIRQSGKVCATAETEWMLIDLHAGKPLRLATHPYVLPYEAHSDEIHRIENVPNVTVWDIEKHFNVRFEDIDYNRHVNHVRYADWVTEAFADALLDGAQITRLRLIYRKQGYYGDQIVLQLKAQQAGHTVFNICNQDNECLCQGEIFLSGEKR